MDPNPPRHRPPAKLYFAYSIVEWKRDQRTLGPRYPVLAEEPGPAHALNPRGTWEGDPWRRQPFRPNRTTRREPKFYEGVRGPRAACDAGVKVVLPIEFDVQDADACPKCVELVVSGDRSVWRERSFGSHRCGEYLRMADQNGNIDVIECRKEFAHSGNHRGPGGEWLMGEEDFIPPPDGYV